MIWHFKLFLAFCYHHSIVVLQAYVVVVEERKAPAGFNPKIKLFDKEKTPTYSSITFVIAN
jgi:hypothetical protein